MKALNNLNTDYPYIWLQRVLGVGSNRVVDILKTNLNLSELCCMNSNDLKNTGIFTESELKKAKNISEESILKTIEYCKNHSIRIITYSSSEYPESFKFTEAPPLVIFARGDIINQSIPYIGIVGARKATELGEKAAYSLAAKLALSGFTIVSGGAMGVDSMAHIGAMNAGGKTIAVLGCGHDSGYLKSNEEMRKKIEKSGTVISEFEPKTPAGRYTFPIRNRLISALSNGVAVIEAGQKSGALITATYAMEQGKELFALPGNINLPQYVGTNELIRDGAVPLISADDIIEVYIGRFPDKLVRKTELSKEIKQGYFSIKSQKAERKKTNDVKGEKKSPQNIMQSDVLNADISEEAKMVLSAFEEEIENSDILSSRSKISAGKFIAAITELEIKGLISAVPIGRYKIKIAKSCNKN